MVGWRRAGSDGAKVRADGPAAPPRALLRPARARHLAPHGQHASPTARMRDGTLHPGRAVSPGLLAVAVVVSAACVMAIGWAGGRALDAPTPLPPHSPRPPRARAHRSGPPQPVGGSDVVSGVAAPFYTHPSFTEIAHPTPQKARRRRPDPLSLGSRVTAVYLPAAAQVLRHGGRLRAVHHPAGTPPRHTTCGAQGDYQVRPSSQEHGRCHGVRRPPPWTPPLRSSCA